MTPAPAGAGKNIKNAAEGNNLATGPDFAILIPKTCNNIGFLAMK